MIEYTKKQKRIISSNVFRHIDRTFSNSEDQKNLRLSRARENYAIFLENLQVRRDFIKNEIDAGIDTQTFFLQMRRHIILDDEVIENMSLLEGWVAENDEEWQERVAERKEDGGFRDDLCEVGAVE